MTGIQVSSFEGGLYSLKKLNSEFSLFAAFTHDVTQICRDSSEELEPKQTRKSASGNLVCFCFIFFSLVAPQLNQAESSARPSQADFRESFLFSSSKSSLSSSPTVVFEKAAVRRQSWRPRVLRGHDRGDSRFILPANLHAWAKSLHHSQLSKVPWLLEK